MYLFNAVWLVRAQGILAQILEKWQAKYRDLRLPFAPKSYVLTLPIFSETNNQHTIGGIENTKEMSSVFRTAFEQALHRSGFPGFHTDSNSDNIIIPDEDSREMSNQKDQVWILKPSITNQAVGISLVRSTSQLRNAIHASDDIQKAGDFVLQRYIPPLLLDGRKFHLRVFLLLTGNLTAYVAKDFLAIFSLEPYEGANLDHTRAHLTNIAHQEVLSDEDQHRCMRRFDETTQDMLDSGVVKTICEAEKRIESVKDRVMKIIAEMVEAVSSELTFSSKDNCFEIFGLDFMIDPDWNTWLLEANAEPDLSKAGERLQYLIDDMLMDTLDLVIGQDTRFQGNMAPTSFDDMNKSNGSTCFVKVYERKGRSF
uniref:ATP-grasp domain-containing protein n=1 Tax=Proboscia inermis TaxID=420281 RepID=A0A7S0CMU2_9STRA|mmetsp:Transcript_6141/g.6341  ORF Transcript_6141/g.6341 Transcript_6141/m.6341 type:complete len:369 (+) Transcript_6141:219-1325(+)